MFRILSVLNGQYRICSPDIKDGPNRVWANLDLIECLLSLADSGAYTDVKELLAVPRKQCPDVLIFSLAEAKVGFV